MNNGIETGIVWLWSEIFWGDDHYLRDNIIDCLRLFNPMIAGPWSILREK